MNTTSNMEIHPKDHKSQTFEESISITPNPMLDEKPMTKFDMIKEQRFRAEVRKYFKEKEAFKKAKKKRKKKNR